MARRVSRFTTDARSAGYARRARRYGVIRQRRNAASLAQRYRIGFLSRTRDENRSRSLPLLVAQTSNHRSRWHKPRNAWVGFPFPVHGPSDHPKSAYVFRFVPINRELQMIDDELSAGVPQSVSADLTHHPVPLWGEMRKIAARASPSRANNRRRDCLWAAADTPAERAFREVGQGDQVRRRQAGIGTTSAETFHNCKSATRLKCDGQDRPLTPAAFDRRTQGAARPAKLNGFQGVSIFTQEPSISL
jgi:hypothetical protein